MAAGEIERATRAAAATPGLRLLLLHGSRARGDARPGSDWDLADAFVRLATAGWIDDGLAARLRRAAGFRNVVAHAYEGLDMARVRAAATDGPADLRAFLRAVRDHLAA